MKKFDLRTPIIYVLTFIILILLIVMKKMDDEKKEKMLEEKMVVVEKKRKEKEGASMALRRLEKQWCVGLHRQKAARPRGSEGKTLLSDCC